MTQWSFTAVFESSAPRRLPGLLLAVWLTLLSSPAAAAEPEAVDELLAAVVGVAATVAPDARTAGTLGTDRFGSGVLIDGNGLVVTIGYVILEAERVEIALPDGRLVPADVLAYDYDSGFGLLRAPAGIPVRPMELGSSTALEPGDRLLIASYGGVETVRPALFAGAREFAGYWEYLLEDALFTVPPYPQFGGAALIAPGGRLVGIGSLAVGDAIDDGQQVPGNMFLPIDRLKSIMGDLLTDGRVSGPGKPWLGIYTEEIQGKLLVRRVVDGGPAQDAGIELGDVIVGIGGKPVYSMADLYRKVWAQGEPGAAISIAVMRGAEIRELTVTSGDRYRWLRSNGVD